MTFGKTTLLKLCTEDLEKVVKKLIGVIVQEPDLAEAAKQWPDVVKTLMDARGDTELQFLVDDFNEHYRPRFQGDNAIMRKSLCMIFLTCALNVENMLDRIRRQVVPAMFETGA